MALVRTTTQANVVARSGKSFKSIIEKPRRQSTRLSSMQDIEGCRIIVDGLIEQDALVYRLESAFRDRMRIQDRREEPSHGYRGVHAIVTLNSCQYEIQIRTVLQHVWAEANERLAGLYGQGIKYGEPGDPKADDIVQLLLAYVRTISAIESIEETWYFVRRGFITADYEVHKRVYAALERIFPGSAPSDLLDLDYMEWDEAAYDQLMEGKNALRKAFLEIIDS